MSLVKVRSPWLCETSEEVEAKVEVCQDGKEFSFDPESVSLESCFAMRRPSGDDGNGSCDLVLSLMEENSKRISSVLLVSGFRRAEVARRRAHAQGAGEEYLATYEGTLVEDSEPGFEMLRIHADLDEFADLASVALRFPGARDECWVMYLAVALKEASTPDASSQTFNLSRLDTMLGGADLSDKARDFKKLFSDFQQRAPPQVSMAAMPPPSLMLAAAAAASNFSTTQRQSERTDDAAVTKRDLLALEKKLCQRLDEQAKRQEDKIDRIISLLEELKSKKVS